MFTLRSARTLLSGLILVSLAIAAVAVFLSSPYARGTRGLLPLKQLRDLASSGFTQAVTPHRFLTNSGRQDPSRSPNMTRPPTYFFSHGGPTVQYETKHPAYAVLQKIGREITQKVKPKAVVVFSAHWEAGRDSIEVNTAVETDLIYDFYGFPDHFYKAKYPNRGDPALANKILALLSNAGIKAKGVTRGLDHGVWSGFHVAFHPEENPLNVPVVQVSLYHNEDPDKHYELGRAVASLRDEGIVIIGAGMSGHNLREMRFHWGDPFPQPYIVSFDDALKEATEGPPTERQARMREVCQRPDARKSHPTMDHLMPVYVAAGAAEEDAGTQTWTHHESTFGWAQYRFGEVPS